MVVGSTMTGLERSVAELDAHLASLPPDARTAAEDLVRALAPLATARETQLAVLLSDATKERVVSVVKAAMVPLGMGRDVGGLLLAAIRKHAPTLAHALRDVLPA